MPSPPRRSTRSVNPPSTKNSNSSSSSVSSSRPERNTRATKNSPPPNEEEMDNNDVSEVEEDGGDEKTRCICGQQDYPGPPSTDEYKALSEESGSLFIQCDRCKVWQHGGCVGIMNDDQAPDEYFCEQCEKKDHRLHTDQKGQRYSIYLPVVRVHQSSRKTSVNRSHDSTLKRDREALARLAAEDLHGPKRRSTMNSRHTYEEEELLRKVIEESKAEQDTGSRKGKRTRDESEDVKIDIKRQRTGSESLDTTLHTASLEDLESEDENGHPTKSALKRARAAAAESIRQREMREREKARDAAREEAAGRRQARAGRRRGDEEDDLPKLPTNQSTKDSPAASRQASPPEIEVTVPSSTHKKSKKPKRTGRNQYTAQRERELARQQQAERETSPRSAKGTSSSSGGEEGKLDAQQAGTTNGTSSGSGKHSPASLSAEGQVQEGSKSHKKGKHKKKEEQKERERNKNPLPEMERQTSWMLEFIARYQAERQAKVERDSWPMQVPVVKRLSSHTRDGGRGRVGVTSHPLSGEDTPGGERSAGERDKELGIMGKEDFEKLDREGKVQEMVRGLAEWRRVFARDEGEGLLTPGSREGVGLGVEVGGR
ncbi:Histone deacetylase complex subunit CTI6-like protein 1 [Elsinoe fawcettii]|nr:Histone deacetylase complex subunit CTI6-like protein 1 [Elsinoe fawcettii]